MLFWFLYFDSMFWQMKCFNFKKVFLSKANISIVNLQEEEEIYI